MKDLFNIMLGSIFAGFGFGIGFTALIGLLLIAREVLV